MPTLCRICRIRRPCHAGYSVVAAEMSSLCRFFPVFPVSADRLNLIPSRLQLCHYGPKKKKTQNESPSNHSLSHERESEQSEQAIKRVSAAERASGASEREHGVSEQVSGASKPANGQVRGPVLTSGFMAVLDHCAHAIFLGSSCMEIWSGNVSFRSLLGGGES